MFVSNLDFKYNTRHKFTCMAFWHSHRRHCLHCKTKHILVGIKDVTQMQLLSDHLFALPQPLYLVLCLGLWGGLGHGQVEGLRAQGGGADWWPSVRGAAQTALTVAPHLALLTTNTLTLTLLSLARKFFKLSLHIRNHVCWPTWCHTGRPYILFILLSTIRLKTKKRPTDITVTCMIQWRVNSA